MPTTTTARKAVAPTQAAAPSAAKKPPVKTAVAKKAAAKKAVVKSPAAKPDAQAAPPTKVKHRLVRDSFTIPKSEYVVLEGLKQRAANLKRPAKKSELLRAGIGALNAMTDKAFLAALSSVPALKTGRPSKGGDK